MHMKAGFGRMVRITLALLAVALLMAGGARKHKVYDNLKEEFGLRSYSDISEYQLVVDATFSGTIRRGNELFSTYDRTGPKKKVACPT
jgi:hypothetical protein